MGKGKVHPSPPLPAAEVAGGETAEAVLMRLLPAAVMAMAEVLGPEGKEVLAYLVLASLRSSSLARWSGEEGNGKGGGGGASGRAVHTPELGCGCFGCYTAYWSRWDGSPERDREAIHRAIEAFEEHLARKEEGKVVPGAGAGAGRRRKKRGKDKPEDKGKAVPAVAHPPPPSPALPEQEGTSTAATALPLNAVAVASCDEAKAADEEEVKATATATTASAADGDGGVIVEEERRRRGWGAVASVLNWRGWGLWGSH